MQLQAIKLSICKYDAYVKLGRVKTLEGLKILRDFTLKDLKRPKDPDIDLELIRLQKLSDITIENIIIKLYMFLFIFVLVE